MSAKKSQTIKARLKAAKLAERSTQVCLRGDLAAEFDELEAQLATVRGNARAADPAKPSSRRMGDKPESVVIAEKMQALREQMAEEMLTVRARALPRNDVKDPLTGDVTEGWNTLVRRHPPKKGHAGDEAMGVDFEGLMAEAVPVCIVEPELDEEDWVALNAVLSSADYDKVIGIVWDVNRHGANLPKSQLASRVMEENADD